MTSVTVLTVDWDFFVYNPNELPRRPITLHPGTARARQVPAHQVFYWFGNEELGGEVLDRLWANRMAECRRFGLDLEKEMAIRPEIGCVPPDDFVTQVSRKLRLGAAPLYVGDSHSLALPICRSARASDGGRPVRVISLDAHCDLGYRAGAVEHQASAGASDCASWLYFCLRDGVAAEAHVVYPDWKGLEEWAWVRELHHVESVADRVRVFTWSDWLSREYGPADRVASIYLCRSSAWSPPWLDGEFGRLANSLPHAGRTCVDCVPLFGERARDFDACRARPWGPTARARRLPG